MEIPETVVTGERLDRRFRDMRLRVTLTRG